MIIFTLWNYSMLLGELLLQQQYFLLYLSITISISINIFTVYYIYTIFRAPESQALEDTVCTD